MICLLLDSTTLVPFYEWSRVLIRKMFKCFEQLVKEDYLELRQEASDLQEYSNAKLDRVTRYLGVLAWKNSQIR